MFVSPQRLLPIAVGALVALAAPHAQAKDDGRPWGRGVMMPSLGIGAGFGSDLTTLSIGAGFGYFVANGLRVGLSVNDTIFIYHESIKRELPGLTDQVTTNSVSVTPSLQYVFFRSRRFSPYAFAGVGPVFRNHDGGVVGRWVAGPGIYIGIVGPLAIDIGFSFSSKFPLDQCNDAFFYDGPTARGTIIDDCSLSYGPRLGFAIGLGGGRSQRERRREPAPEYEWKPLPESEATPAEPESSVPAPAAPAEVETPPESATETIASPEPDETSSPTAEDPEDAVEVQRPTGADAAEPETTDPGPADDASAEGAAPESTASEPDDGEPPSVG